jgi:hypothetical protein
MHRRLWRDHRHRAEARGEPAEGPAAVSVVSGEQLDAARRGQPDLAPAARPQPQLQGQRHDARSLGFLRGVGTINFSIAAEPASASSSTA